MLSPIGHIKSCATYIHTYVHTYNTYAYVSYYIYPTAIAMRPICRLPLDCYCIAVTTVNDLAGEFGHARHAAMQMDTRLS